MTNNKNILFIILFVIFIGVLGFGFYKYKSNLNVNNPIEINNKEKSNFEYKFIKNVNKYNLNTNYMISPLSMAYGLSLVMEGSKGNSYEQLNKVLNNNYSLIDDFNVPERITMANAIFIKDAYKKDIKDNFVNNLKSKYNSEVLYDKFENPKVINDWVDEKTYNMIPEILNDISSDFVLGLANAIAIDVDWQNPFQCLNTRKIVFNKIDNTKIDSVMMNEYADSGVSYLKNEKAEGIIKNYAYYDKTTGKLKYSSNSIRLQYIAIMPNDINKYINNFSYSELKSLLDSKKDASDSLKINLSLPRYKYDFKLEDEKLNSILKNMGITDIFDSEKSDFSNITDSFKLVINKSIHQTHIELNEKGTKAGAVTYFGMNESVAKPQKFKVIDIKFDKPFIYLIKEKESDNIMFFGTVFEPEIWNNDLVKCEENK